MNEHKYYVDYDDIFDTVCPKHRMYKYVYNRSTNIIYKENIAEYGDIIVWCSDGEISKDMIITLLNDPYDEEKFSGQCANCPFVGTCDTFLLHVSKIKSMSEDDLILVQNKISLFFSLEEDERNELAEIIDMLHSYNSIISQLIEKYKDMVGEYLTYTGKNSGYNLTLTLREVPSEYNITLELLSKYPELCKYLQWQISKLKNSQYRLILPETTVYKPIVVKNWTRKTQTK